MKKLIITPILALLMTVTAFAQEAKTDAPQQERKAPTVEEVAKRKADHMRQQYLLGEDQYNKVYKLCLKQAKQDEARRKEIEAERAAMEKDMKGILNDAQWERYEKNKKQGPMHRAPFNNRRNFKKGQFPHFMPMGQMGRRPMGPQMMGHNFKGAPQGMPQKGAPMMQMPPKGMNNHPMPQFMGEKPFDMPKFDGKPMGEPKAVEKKAEEVTKEK